MSIYGEDEDIELFSVNYGFDADSCVNGEDLSGLLQFRALAAVERPITFAAWGTNGNSFDSFSTAGPAADDQVAVAAVAKTEVHVRSSSERATSGSFVEPPFGLPMASQFAVAEKSSGDLMQRIGEFLNHSPKTADFDFSFSRAENMWRGKCLIGATCLEVDVRVYYRHAAMEFVIAVLKMRGSEPQSVSFADFFLQLRQCITGEQFTKRRKIDPSAVIFAAQSLPAPTIEEFLEGAAPIQQMASDECFDVRLEAAKMMCDMASKSSEYLDVPEFRQICLSVLEVLVQDSFEDVRQHAVMAISAFAVLDSYRDAILSSESVLLPILFSAIENAPNYESQSWQTVKVRRTSASVVSGLCNRNAAVVFDQLQRLYDIDISTWAVELVPTLLDMKTKVHAEAIVVSHKLLQAQRQSSSHSTEMYHASPDVRSIA